MLSTPARSSAMAGRRGIEGGSPRARYLNLECQGCRSTPAGSGAARRRRASESSRAPGVRRPCPRCQWRPRSDSEVLSQSVAQGRALAGFKFPSPSHHCHWPPTPSS
eukprot:3644961-Rhodomonas_salina.1